jgi:hypothetical protein
LVKVEKTLNLPAYKKVSGYLWELPVPGFDLKNKSRGRVAEHDFDVVEYYHPLLIFSAMIPASQFSPVCFGICLPGMTY